MAWWLVVASLLLGPLLAVPGMLLAGLSARSGGDWRPTVALGCMVVCTWLALVGAAVGMG